MISRIGSQGTRLYTYDKQGSLVEERNGDECKWYHYDSLNRQQEVIRADGTFQRNCYDAEGLRAEMEENGRLCRFIFHRGEIISEEAGSESGGYLSSRYIRGNGVEYLEQDGTAYSFQKDEQGSTVFLLNREKEICGSYAYDGFGNLRKNAGPGKHGNRILYTGQQYDGWSEQYYLRARYYSPAIGRFTQEDVCRGDGLNLYAYCANNPVTYYDPSGYVCESVGFNKDGISEGILWGSWDDYEKVIVNDQEYAAVGGRLYSHHAVDRMQPSGMRCSSNAVGGPVGASRIMDVSQTDYGRGVAPQYVENVIGSTKPMLQDNGNLIYDAGGLNVVTNSEGSVVTIMTK